MHAIDVNHQVANAAHRIRTRNLGEVLNGKRLPGATGRQTPWQRQTLAAFRHAGLSGFAIENGTIRGTEFRPAPAGGYTEEWVSLVTPRDVTRQLSNPYAT